MRLQEINTTIKPSFPFLCYFIFLFSFLIIKKMDENSNEGVIPENKIFGFVGGGNMAKAIGVGLLQKGVLKPNQVYVSAPSAETLYSWKRLGVNVTHSNNEIIEKCDVIILAFKPYQLDIALNDIKLVSKSKLFISILVGVSFETIKSKVEKFCSNNCVRIIRAMPNVAVAVCEGCTVIAPDESATPEDVELVKTLFSAVGTCEKISENLMEAAAAVAGSGPAYIFLTIEAMADGLVKNGIPRQQAYKIVSQTVLGASKLVLETGTHPAKLKDDVCSPGGTTICGVHELEKGNLRGIFINAIDAATSRAKQIKSKAQ